MTKDDWIALWMILGLTCFFVAICAGVLYLKLRAYDGNWRCLIAECRVDVP